MGEMIPSSPLHFHEHSGEIPREVIRIHASALPIAEAAILANQWEAALAANDWQGWRSMAVVDPQGEVIAAIVGRVYAGNLAAVWPPQVCSAWQQRRAGEILLVEALCNDLVERFVAFLSREPITLLQATLSPGDISGERLQRNQFQLAAELLFLSCPAELFPIHPPSSDLSFEPYTPSQFADLSAIVEATYRHTLDVPALNGLRSTADVIDGYLATGSSGSQHWRLIYQGNQPIGCLILAEHAPHRLLELVYMGIAPVARGKGWGEVVVAYAKWLSRSLQISQLVLTVDEANHPARRIYAAAGFSPWDRRRVLLRTLVSNADETSQTQ